MIVPARTSPLKMTLNNSGIRDISRVLSISVNTVLKQIRQAAEELPRLRPPTKAQTVELDEFWSFVGSKSNQRWTWLGLTSATHRIGAFVNGRRTDKNCRELLQKYQNSRISGEGVKIRRLRDGNRNAALRIDDAV